MTAQTEALRKLADFIDEHPELDFGPGIKQGTLYIQGDDLNFFPPYQSEPDVEKRFARDLIHAFGGVWDKDPSGSSMTFQQKHVFDFFTTTIFVERESVCERRLVGTKDVEVPAQKAVKAHTETVPVYEWECGSLLSPSEPELESVNA